jgi:hypothetical protein
MGDDGGLLGWLVADAGVFHEHGLASRAASESQWWSGTVSSAGIP